MCRSVCRSDGVRRRMRRSVCAGIRMRRSVGRSVCRSVCRSVGARMRLHGSVCARIRTICRSGSRSVCARSCMRRSVCRSIGARICMRRSGCRSSCCSLRARIRMRRSVCRSVCARGAPSRQQPLLAEQQAPLQSRNTVLQALMSCALWNALHSVRSMTRSSAPVAAASLRAHRRYSSSRYSSSADSMTSAHVAAASLRADCRHTSSDGTRGAAGSCCTGAGRGVAKYWYWWGKRKGRSCCRWSRRSRAVWNGLHSSKGVSQRRLRSHLRGGICARMAGECSGRVWARRVEGSGLDDEAASGRVLKGRHACGQDGREGEVLEGKGVRGQVRQRAPNKRLSIDRQCRLRAA